MEEQTILINGESYALDTVELTAKDIRRLHKGECLMFGNKETRRVIAVSKLIKDNE